MRLIQSTFMSIVALGLAAPATAFAADYDPPLVVEQAPEYVPVEAASGWYLRGDLGYDLNDVHDTADFGGAIIDNRYDEYRISGSLGAGYHFTDYLRAEVNVGYLPGDKFGFDTLTAGPITASADIRNKAWYGMVNGYVDLGTYAGLTPYVGAGIGVLRTDRRFVASFDDTVNSFDYNVRDTKYAMAYTLNAGLAYQVTPNLSVDVGYQFLDSPDAEYTRVNSISDYSVEKGLKHHQVRVGLRYDLW